MALGGTYTAPLWSFLTFTQNLDMRAGETFTHSWSLCIEEQFYVIFPLLALLIATTKRSIALGWTIIIAAMLCAMFLRGFNWYAHGQAAMSSPAFMEYIYYSSFTRFDELLPGVAVAMLKNFHPAVYDRILHRGNWIFLLGLASVTIMFFVFRQYSYIEGYGFSFLTLTFGYSFLAMSFAILILAALSPKSLLHRLRIPGAASIALWSYAIYLIHKPLFQLLKTPLTDYGVNINQCTGVAIIMGISIFCGWLLFVTVETPFMKFRNRFYPSNNAISNSELVVANRI